MRNTKILDAWEIRGSTLIDHPSKLESQILGNEKSGFFPLRREVRGAKKAE